MNPFGSKQQDPDLTLFTVFDSKSKVYEAPMLVRTKEALLRDIINLMNDPKNQMAPKVLNAEDFAIFKIGEFNFREGKLTTVNHEHVANFHDLRAMSNWKQPEYIVESRPVIQNPALLPT